MSWPGVFDPGNNCSFCGHGFHDGACVNPETGHPRTINVRRGRPPKEQTIPCPCKLRNFQQPADGAVVNDVHARADVDSGESDPPGALLGRSRSTGGSDHPTSKES